MPRLAVVIVAWNARDDVLACLASLPGDAGGDDLVVVCDNGSDDGTVDAVRARHAAVEIVENGSNLGFAGGSNAGLRLAIDRGFEWAMLLNADTTVPRGTIDALLAYAALRSSTAAFQPLLVSASDPRRIDSAGHVVFRVPGAIDGLMGEDVDLAPREPTPVFGACGAAALIRVSALRKVGLLDERLFVLCEDVDLMFRLRIAGYEVELVPQARVLHRRGISGREQTPDVARRRRFWLERNTVALALRYWPMRWLLATSPYLLVRALRALRLARAAPDPSCLALWRVSARARAVNRAAMRARGLDRWFRVRPKASVRQ